MRNSNSGLNLVLVLAAVWPLWSLDASRNSSQYVRHKWGVEQGLAPGPIYAISQSRDGYLWLGTERGLLRFDGFEFELREEKSPLGVPVTHVLGLLPAPGGGLWVRMRRTAQSLYYWDGKAFRDAFHKQKSPHPSVSAMAPGANGELLLWALSGEPFAGVLRDGRAQRLAEPQGFSRSPVLSLLQDRLGALWVGTRDAGLFRVFEGKVEAVRDGLPDLKVNALTLGSQGELWVGTDAGLARWDGRRLEQGGALQELRGIPILSLLTDREGNIWAGTNERGLLRLNSSGLEWMEGKDARGRQAVTTLFEDREGNLWVGSGSGLERIRDSAFVNFSQAEGLPSEAHGAIALDAEGGLWAAPVDGGLWHRKNGVVRRVVADGLDRDVVYAIATNDRGVWLGRQSGRLTLLPYAGGATQSWNLGDSVFAVHCARDASVWAGTLSSGAVHLKNGSLQPFTKGSGLAANAVQALFESRSGAMFFSTPAGLREFSGGQWRKHPLQGVNCFAEDRQGNLWAGGDDGVSRWDGQRWHRYPAMPEGVRSLTMDAHGDWWIATTERILRLGKEGRRDYGGDDGLRATGGVKRHRALAAGSDGRIWFATNRGVAFVDPAKLRETSPDAIPHIHTLLADGAALSGTMRVPEGTHRLILRYAGLFLGAPQEVRYRYRLDGFDDKWSDATAAREALYTNLPPRDYRFRLMTRNAEGDWNPTEASLAFSVAPQYWQTWWFRLAGAAAAAALLALAWRMRLRQWRQEMQLRFDERLAERTRIAQELHDTLLQGFLGASMQLHVATEALPADSPQRKPFERVASLMSQVIGEGRNALRGLRSQAAGQAGLAKELADAPVAMGFSGASQYRVIVDGEARALEPSAREEIYRIGREAILNAFRHARAENIDVELLFTSRSFRMRVRDDGCGMEPQILESGKPGHWGLTGMRERARKFGAELIVRSRVGAGTEVELAAPGARVFAQDTVRTWTERLTAWMNRKEAAK